MSAISAEGEAEKIALVRIFTEPVVGKIGDLAGLEVENRDGLAAASLLGAIAGMQHGGKLAVGTEGNCGGETIKRRKNARRRCKRLTCRQVDRGWLAGFLARQRQDRNEYGGKVTGCASQDSSGVIQQIGSRRRKNEAGQDIDRLRSSA
jgi:hypothetical protein